MQKARASCVAELGRHKENVENTLQEQIKTLENMRDNMKANRASGTNAYLRRTTATDNRAPRWCSADWPKLRIADTKA